VAATLQLKITGDARDGIKALDDAEDRAGRFSGAMGKIGLGAAAGLAVAGGALIGLGKQAFDAASDLQQSTGSINAVFDDWAGSIEDSAKTASTAVGLSTSEYENMAAVIGSQLKNAGNDLGDTTEKTQALIATGADMAAVFGGTASDAVEALSSALKGEMDPIEKYGVSLNQAAIQSQLAADGNDKLTGAALKNAQSNAILELITKQTADTQGQWAAQSGTAAEAQQILGAKVDNIKAKLGEGLLPVFAGAATFLSDKVLPAFDNLTASGGPLSEMFDKVGAFVRDQVMPVFRDQLVPIFQNDVVPAFGAIVTVIRDNAVPIFEKIVGYVRDYVIPILKTILTPVIDGVRSVFEKLAEKLNDNRDKFEKIYEKVQPFLAFLRDQVAPFIGGTLKLAFEGLSKVLGPVVDTITWILDKAASVVGFIGKVGSLFGGGHSDGGSGNRGLSLFGASAGAAPLRAASAGGGMGSGAATGSAGLGVQLAGGDTYQITINGVLDADDAAEKIARLLERRDRMTGRISAGAF
jgi:hypothetical protein